MSKKKFARRQVGDTVSVAVPQKRNESLPKGISCQGNWFMLALFIIPFVISREAIDPTITIRYLLLSIFVSVFVLYFYIYRKEPIFLPLPTIVTAVFVCGLAFTGWSLVATSFSINKSAGYYEILRYLLNLTLLFLVMQMAYKEGSQIIIRIGKILVVAALLHSFIGIFQYYEFAFNELPGANDKPYGLMANRNLYGSAQVLLLPFIIFVAYRCKGVWRIVASISGFFSLFSILLSQTRSAWVAAFAIMACTLLLIIIYMPFIWKKWFLGTMICLAVTFALAGLMVIADSEGELSQSLTERAASLTVGITDTSNSASNVQERFKIWKKTVSLISDNPIIGTGPANWKLAIAPYGTQGLAWAKGNFVPDSPHNLYLQLAAETGLPGALFYLGLFVFVVVAGLKTIRKVKQEDRLLIILMLAGMAAFASDSMFSFPADRIEHSVYLMLMAGIIIGIYRSTAVVTITPTRNINKLSYLLILIAAANTFLAVKKHRFEVHLNYAKALEKAGRYAEVLEEAEEGKNDFVKIDMVGTSLETKASVAYNELKDYPRALEESKKAIKLHPHSPMVYNNMGTIYTNMNDFSKAIEYYKKALLYASDYDIVLKNLAVNYYRVGNYNECINTLKRVKVEEDQYLVDLMSSARKMSVDSGQAP